MFPIDRPRRLRRTEALRRLVRETRLSPGQLVYPLFATGGRDIRRPVTSMPGVFQCSPELILAEARECAALGIGGLLLFGVPERKDEQGSGAWDAEGPVARALLAIREAALPLVSIADVCLCDYTSHGHCGVLEGGAVHNDATLPLLARAAVAMARAGADVVAPSDMMDGRIGAVREALDEANFQEISILSYAAKYASCLYAPFREAAQNAPREGDRRGYQMDPANGREALREVAEDLREGADLVMVKPALACLDVIRRVAEISDRPVAAYNVSGEYAMVKAAAERGWLDERRAVLEVLTAIARAGAGVIATYHAKEAARWLA